MKKILFILFSFNSLALADQCQITSPLPVPVTISGCSFSGTLPQGSTSYIQNSLSPTTTTQAFSVQNATFTKSVYFPYLTSGQCHTTDATGLLTTTTCGGGGGGGSSTLAIFNGSPLISSPTAIVNFNSPTFTASLVGGATAQIVLSQIPFAISLGTGTMGTLPYQVSLSTGISGSIPSFLVSLSTGVFGTLPYQTSLTTATMGVLPYQISLSTGVSGSIPSFLVSLSTGVFGTLPYQIALGTATTGVLPYFVSLSSGVMSTLPAASIAGGTLGTGVNLGYLVSLSTGTEGPLGWAVSLSTGTMGTLPYAVSLATGTMATLPYLVSLSSGVMSTLPAASIAAGSLGVGVNLGYNISLSTGSMATLPYQTSLSTGVTATLPYQVSLGTGSVGTIPYQISLSTGIMNALTVSTITDQGTLNVSSNAILSGATFYQNAPIQISSEIITGPLTVNMLSAKGANNWGLVVSTTSNSGLAGDYTFGVSTTGYIASRMQIGISTGAVATCAVGTGAGSGASCTISGTNEYGVLTVTAAGTPTASAVISSQTITVPVPNGVVCVISPHDTTTGLLAAAKQGYSVGGSSNTWALWANTTALSAVTYSWNYHCGGY